MLPSVGSVVVRIFVRSGPRVRFGSLFFYVEAYFEYLFAVSVSCLGYGYLAYLACCFIVFFVAGVGVPFG